MVRRRSQSFEDIKEQSDKNNIQCESVKMPRMTRSRSKSIEKDKVFEVEKLRRRSVHSTQSKDNILGSNQIVTRRRSSLSSDKEIKKEDFMTTNDKSCILDIPTPPEIPVKLETITEDAENNVPVEGERNNLETTSIKPCNGEKVKIENTVDVPLPNESEAKLAAGVGASLDLGIAAKELKEEVITPQKGKSDSHRDSLSKVKNERDRRSSRRRRYSGSSRSRSRSPRRHRKKSRHSRSRSKDRSSRRRSNQDDKKYRDRKERKDSDRGDKRRSVQDSPKLDNTANDSVKIEVPRERTPVKSDEEGRPSLSKESNAKQDVVEKIIDKPIEEEKTGEKRDEVTSNSNENEIVKDSNEVDTEKAETSERIEKSRQDEANEEDPDTTMGGMVQLELRAESPTFDFRNEDEAEKSPEKTSVPFKSSRRVSLAHSRSRDDEDRPKKPKWSGATSDTEEISSQTLKSLVPDIKPLSPSEVKMDRSSSEKESGNEKKKKKRKSINEDDEYEDREEVKERRDRKNKDKKREISVDGSPKKKSRKSEGEYEKSAKKKDKEQRREQRKAREDIKLYEKRRISSNDRGDNASRKYHLLEAGPSQSRPAIAPAHNPCSKVVVVRNLVRPFTMKQLKDLLQRTGRLTPNGFWIDNIKSMCLAMYENEDQAEETRVALHGVKWPTINPKNLHVDFSSEMELEDKILETSYFQPVVAEEPRRERRKIERPVREWDLAKMGERSPGEREREKERLRTQKEEERALRERERERSREHKKEGKARKAAPPKTLDTLFRKTKAQPSVYWLPLTDEQITIKEAMRRKRMAEAEKKYVEMQAEREKQRKEREIEREKRKEKEKIREKEREQEREKLREERAKRSPSRTRRKSSRSRSRNRSSRRSPRRSSPRRYRRRSTSRDARDRSASRSKSKSKSRNKSRSQSKS